MFKRVGLFLVGLLIAGAAFAQDGSGPLSGTYYPLNKQLVPFTAVGLTGNNSTDEGLALQAATQVAKTNNYTLVGNASMIFKSAANNIVLASDASIEWNGAKVNCTGLASGYCVTFTPYGSYGSGQSAASLPGQSGLGVYCGANGYTGSINGLYFNSSTGGSPPSLANETFKDFSVYNCATGVTFGSNVFLVTFVNLRSVYNNLYGIDFGTGSNAGENLNFFGGDISNIANSSGTAYAVYNHSASHEASFHSVSMDYNDNEIYISGNGTVHMFGCHLETNGNLGTNAAPFITVSAGGGDPTLDGEGNLFLQAGHGGTGNPEAFGGRPAIISETGNQASVSLDHTTWQVGASEGNYNTQWLSQTNNGLAEFNGLTIYNQSGSASFADNAPEFAKASPAYYIGWPISSTFTTSGWLSDQEVNRFRNSSFSGGTVSNGSNTGTLPTNMVAGGITTGGTGLTYQFLGVAYPNGRPQAQIRIYGVYTSTSPYIYLEGGATGLTPAMQYDNVTLVAGYQLINESPLQTSTALTVANGVVFRTSVGGVASSASGTAVNLTPNRQLVTYNVSATSGTTNYVAMEAIFAGAAFTAGNYVDFTVGIDEPEILTSNGPITQGTAQITSGSSIQSYYGYGLDTGSSNLFQGNSKALHMWGITGATGTYNPLYISIPVKPKQHVLASAWLKFDSTYVSGSAGLFYECDDAQGNIITSGPVDGSAYNSTGYMTPITGSGSTTTITFTGTPTGIAVGQNLFVSSGTGAFPNGDTIKSGSGTTWVVATPPTTALSSATVTSGYVEQSGMIVPPDGTVTVKIRPTLSSLVGGVWFNSIEGTAL